jgi:hypothetical protein
MGALIRFDKSDYQRSQYADESTISLSVKLISICEEII